MAIVTGIFLSCDQSDSTATITAANVYASRATNNFLDDITHCTNEADTRAEKTGFRNVMAF